jgi:hypothetical protein
MATIINSISESKTVGSLDTYQHTALLTSPYTVAVRLTETPPSGCTITIKQNSTTIASTSAPAAAQQVINLRGVINATAGDVIQVIIASSAAIDQDPQSIQATIQIVPGYQA